MPATDFFISYTGADVAWARWVAWELERANFTTIYQDRDFVPGRAFMQQMRDAARSSRRTIALLSEKYLASEFSALELNAALTADPTGCDRKLIPVRIEPCPIDALLRDRVYIDLAGVVDKRQARRLLLDGVRAADLSFRRGADGERAPRFPADVPAAAATSTELHIGAVAPVNPLKVLFLASEAGTGLDLRNQYRAIRKSIAASRQPDAIRFKAVFNVTASSLFDALNSYAPHVVHFSGKQDAGDILIHTDDGKLTTLSDRAFSGMIRSLDANVRIVAVDTCYSLPCAIAIARTVDFTLGVKSFIYEDDATSFYCTFYQALAAGRSIENATAQAKARLTMARVPASQIPQLRYRKGADPTSRIVAAQRSPSRRA